MSTVKPFITTAGATLAFGIIGTAPANAALLDFNFSTRNGSTGSFTLNTSIPNSNSDTYANAVTNFKYSGLESSSPLNLFVVQRNLSDTSGTKTVLQVAGFPNFRLDLYFNNLNLVNRLSDNPSDYSPYFATGDNVDGIFAGSQGIAGVFAGYGGGFESLPGGEKNILGGDLDFFYTPVTSVAVVPEGDTVLGSFVALTFLGMVWLKGRLQRRETT